MKRNVLLIVASPVLLFLTGCNKNTAMDNPSTNAPAALPPSSSTMATNSPRGPDTVNRVPAPESVTNLAGIETNLPAPTNGMNTITNMSPP